MSKECGPALTTTGKTWSCPQLLSTQLIGGFYFCVDDAMWIYYLAGRFVVRDCFEPKTTHDRTLLQPVVPSQSMHCVSLTAQSLAVGASPRAGN